MNTGECVCKPGFSGHTCNCAVGSHSCNTTVSDCYYESNQILCICKAGFTSLEHGCVGKVSCVTNNNIFLCNQHQYILAFFVRETFFKEIWIGLTDKKQFNCVEINHYYLHVHTDQARSKTQLRKIGERILLMQDRYAWYHHSFFPYLS